MEKYIIIVQIFSNQILMDVFNNLLRATNRAGWSELQTTGSGSQTLLFMAERYGRYLASLLNETNGPFLLIRENICEYKTSCCAIRLA